MASRSIKQPAMYDNNKYSTNNYHAHRSSINLESSKCFNTPQQKVSSKEAIRNSTSQLPNVFSRPVSDREFLRMKDYSPHLATEKRKQTPLNLETPDYESFSTPNTKILGGLNKKLDATIDSSFVLTPKPNTLPETAKWPAALEKMTKMSQIERIKQIAKERQERYKRPTSK